MMLTTNGQRMFDAVCDMVETHGLDLYGHDTSVDQWNPGPALLSFDGTGGTSNWRPVVAGPVRGQAT